MPAPGAANPARAAGALRDRARARESRSLPAAPGRLAGVTLAAALAVASCRAHQGAAPDAVIPSCAPTYAAALRKGAESELAELSSLRVRAELGHPRGPAPAAPDRQDAADAIDEAVRRCASTPTCAREIRAEPPGARAVRLVAETGGWRLAAMPLSLRNASVDEAVASFLQALERRDPDALFMLIGEQRPNVLRAITDRAEALKARRATPEVVGSRARVRVADSWWLIIESTPMGWKVVGSEP